jgi:hypothetical protein
MKSKRARILFLIVCVILALLLIFKIISPITSGVIFAVALVLFGILTAGFRRK